MGEGAAVLSVMRESEPPPSPSRRPSQSRTSVLDAWRIGRDAVRMDSVLQKSAGGSIVRELERTGTDEDMDERAARFLRKEKQWISGSVGNRRHLFGRLDRRLI